MAVRRKSNWLGQQRVDIQHLKSIESAVSNDFDELLSGLVTGRNKSFIIRGFEINMTGAIGSAANGLQLLIEDSSFLHGSSEESGTFFTIPENAPAETLNNVTNNKVEGSFTPDADNYVGIEFFRQPDDATSDITYFWITTTNTETSRVVPQAITLGYRIRVSTTPFSSNTLPVAIIRTNSSNGVISVTDQRNLLYRLGTAGDQTPNPFYVFPWSEGRSENPVTSNNSLVSPFRGGDKQLFNMKEWFDAIMTEFKLLKGTPFWYTESIGGSIAKLRADTANTVFTGSGVVRHDSTIAGKINWTADLFINFIGGRIKYRIKQNELSSDIVLSANQVAYLKLVRDVEIIPNLIFTQNDDAVTSVGNIAWTSQLQAGDYVKIKDSFDDKYYRIQSVDSLSQVTLTEDYQESSTGLIGVRAEYAFGVYETSPTPSTDRHIHIADRGSVPFGQDHMWLLYRQDDNGPIVKVYARFLNGQEIEQGEEREPGDNQSLNILLYTGSTSEIDTNPKYEQKYESLATHQLLITFPVISDIDSGDSFEIYSVHNLRHYVFHFVKDGVNLDPQIPNTISVPIFVSTGFLPTQITNAVQTAFSPFITDFQATASGPQIEIAYSTSGRTTGADNINMHGTFNINVLQQGSGALNRFIFDNENLTISIKRLDEALKALEESQDYEAYEEIIEVVSLVTDINYETTPQVAPFILNIPPDNRKNFFIKTYEVGAGQLEVFLNGQQLNRNFDYEEVGVNGDDSREVRFLIDLELYDTVTYRIDNGSSVAVQTIGGGGGGDVSNGENVGVGANVFKVKTGPNLQFRRLREGSGVTITQNADDITIAASVTASPLLDVEEYDDTVVLTPSNDLAVIDSTNAPVTVFLPTAAGNKGKKLIVKRIGPNNVTVTAEVGEFIDGLNVFLLEFNYETVAVVSTGVNWVVV